MRANPLGQTEVALLKQIVAAFGYDVTGEQEVELLKQIAGQWCGVSIADMGQQEVELLKQIADYCGVSPMPETEVELLQGIVLHMPDTAYTQADIGQNEVELLKQWFQMASGGPAPSGAYVTNDGWNYLTTPDGTEYYQQP